METMDSKMMMVSALARAGFDDAQISKVLEVAQPRGFRFGAAPAVMREGIREVAHQRPIPPKPAPASAALFDVTPPPAAPVANQRGSDDRSNSYRPLFEKIRAHCAANGPTDDTARGFCDRFPDEFKLSRTNLTHPANARGFAQVIESHGGVFGGVRFTKLPSLPPRHGRGAAVALYRAEVA